MKITRSILLSAALILSLGCLLFTTSGADHPGIDLAAGGIVIYADGYTVDGGEKIEHHGSYIIYQSTDKTTNTIVVAEGTHDVVLQNTHIDASDGGKAAVTLEPGTDTTLTLQGKNSLVGGYRHAGLQTETEDGPDAVLTIAGSGSLYAQGGEDGAGIGAGYEGRGGTMTILSGTVEAHGGRGGAGIGGGGNSGSFRPYDCSGGTITVSGGTITAVGGKDAAGIGGGNHGDGGSITVNGGTILLAEGGAGGAGIGSGLGSHVGADKGPGYYSGGVITLTGNYVIQTAQGGGNAAGIGGGMYGDSGTLQIIGGTIHEAFAGAGDEASPHHGAAGIGAGYQGHCDVYIFGATIGRAVGSSSGAGIGSGSTANSDRRPNPTVAQASTVEIRAAVIDLALGGSRGGAGIGGGASAEQVTVTICGKHIIARGQGGGAGIGSGFYSADYKYSVTTALFLNLECGNLDADSDTGDNIGSGGGNDEGDVEIDNNRVDFGETEVPFAMASSLGYVGFYDGMAYSIHVALEDAEEILYAKEKDGAYTEDNPTYTEVGEYTTYYRARVHNVLHTGSDTVVIKPLDEGGGETPGPPIDPPDPGNGDGSGDGNGGDKEIPGEAGDSGEGDTEGSDTIPITSPSTGDISPLSQWPVILLLLAAFLLIYLLRKRDK